MTHPWVSSFADSARHLSAEAALDAHVHVGRWSRAPYEGIETTWDDTAAVLAAAGVAGAVVLPTGPGGNGALLDDLCRSHRPEPAWFFPWIAPGDADALEFAIAHADAVAGLKLHPSFDRCRIVDPGYDAVLRTAAARGWPVLLHCGRWQEMAGWSLALEAAERHPELRFILAHLGGDEPELRRAGVAAAHARGLRNVWFETSGAREFWLIRELVDGYGHDWLLYGSDFNLHHPTAMLSVLFGADLPPAALDAVLAGNLRRLLDGRPRFVSGAVC